MAFDDLPAQPPIYPEQAEAYAEQALRLSREAALRTRCVLDIPYGDDYWQKIDVYQPDEPGEGLPVLVFAHGGAWSHGYKEWMGLMAPAIVATPAIFVSVSYRLAPAVRFPAPLDDCVAALRWVRDHIADYGGSGDRIYVGGHSAGGHLFALATLRRDVLARAGLAADTIKACFPVSSQLNLVFDTPEPGSGEARIYEIFLAQAEDAPAASPLHQLEGNRTPFFISYGERDFPRIIASSRRVIEELARQPSGVRSAIYAAHGHFDTALGLADADHPWNREVRAWLREGTAPALG
ncbi:alpha/beta hydrolase [Pigmentiphaga sp. NML080357]|uniref:alpha/beta hydrolase n=1 Tax=Pigmentiphaga sp. NML080357 TaxID=2008675 RepID=UPI0013032DB0|nr:alpha/beta hydrolase [Pigmentiphaga sp. NML080357]